MSIEALEINPVDWAETILPALAFPNADRETARRLLSKIYFTDSCWNWTGGHRRGYGRFKWNGRDIGAHRAAWLMMRGPITEQTIDHVCRNRLCVRPDGEKHLEPVSQRVNTLRGYGTPALNAKKTHCQRGHEFTPENTFLDAAGKGRSCRACLAMLHRKYEQSEKYKALRRNYKKTERAKELRRQYLRRKAARKRAEKGLQ